MGVTIRISCLLTGLKDMPFIISLSNIPQMGKLRLNSL